MFVDYNFCAGFKVLSFGSEVIPGTMGLFDDSGGLVAERRAVAPARQV